MSVRIATRYDIETLLDMMEHYADCSPIDALKIYRNRQYVRQLFTEILMGSGVAWIAERNNTSVGMLIAIRGGNFWNPDVKYMSEICWWVEPEYRNMFDGYKLIHSYKNYATNEIEQGKIAYYTLSKMNNSPDIDYNRLGLNKLEETHICQQV